MREIKGNVWDLAVPGDIICITTNGFVKKNGEAVMGRGIALEAKRRDPEVARVLGLNILAMGGPHVVDIHQDPDFIWLAFPVKHNWWEEADPELIIRSTHELVEWIDRETDMEGGVVWLPRPGCGNGGLDWADVKPLIEPLLDDRFVVVSL